MSKSAKWSRCEKGRWKETDRGTERNRERGEPVRKSQRSIKEMIFFLSYFFKIVVWLIFNTVLVSAV